MKLSRISQSLLALTALAACDAAIVANQQAAAEAEANVQADVAVQVEGGSDAVVVAEAPEGEATVEVKAEVKAEISPENLDLEGITYLIKKGKVKNADELEKKINSPKEKINNIDIDGDGKVDKIQIVEVKKDDGTIIFELHAIPSKSKDKDAYVVVAYISFVPDKTTNVLVVKATYAPVVVGHETIVYDYTTPIVVKNDTIVVSGGVAFYGWLYKPRPAYVGVVVWDGPEIFVVDVHHDCWPPGHCKHHHHHHHHGHHGHHKVKVKHKHKWH
ncbi:MAG TPA: hypothetical protein VIK91_11030 [Nannocystis sp.]